jgi:putative ferrous iron transport protein C
MLRDITELLKQRGGASLEALSIHFAVDPPAMAGMLQLLERKGRVRRLPAGCGSGGPACKHCPMAESVAGTRGADAASPATVYVAVEDGGT